MKSKIHVNQHHIRINNMWNKSLPVFTVKQGKKNFYAESIEIKGPPIIVYKPDEPLSCGARVWIETESEVVMQGQTTFMEVHK